MGREQAVVSNTSSVMGIFDKFSIKCPCIQSVESKYLGNGEMVKNREKHGAEYLIELAGLKHDHNCPVMPLVEDALRRSRNFAAVKKQQFNSESEYLIYVNQRRESWRSQVQKTENYLKGFTHNLDPIPAQHYWCYVLAIEHLNLHAAAAETKSAMTTALSARQYALLVHYQMEADVIPEFVKKTEETAALCDKFGIDKTNFRKHFNKIHFKPANRQDPKPNNIADLKAVYNYLRRHAPEASNLVKIDLVQADR